MQCDSMGGCYLVGWPGWSLRQLVSCSGGCVGFLYIPGTRRPDGSYRKPIKVKEGYIPQDEQPTYETIGTKWQKDRPACPGLAPAPAAVEEPQSKGSERNRKKKEARKKAAEKMAQGDDSKAALSRQTEEALTERLKSTNITSDSGNLSASPSDVARRLKNLRKRLAQIDALKAKMDSGELANPDPDQVRKVQRRSEVVEEMKDLEMEL